MHKIENLFFGPYVRRSQKALVYGVGFIFAGVIVNYSFAYGLHWQWWQILIALAVSFDVPAGAVANNLVAVKRHWGRLRSRGHHWQKVLANRTNFALLHIVYIVAMGLAFWDASWLFIVVMAMLLMGASLAVQSVHGTRARALAVAAVALTMLVNIAFHPPTALWWFMPLLIVKVINGFTTPLRA